MTDLPSELPAVDLRTLLGEMAALKTEVRAETTAAREVRAELADLVPALRGELERATSREQTLRKAAADERRRGVRALMDLADRLEATRESLATPVKLGFLVRADPRVAALREGLDLTLQRLTEHLASAGARRVETKGRAFDAATMEAVEVTHRPDVADGLVVDEVSAGYADEQGPLRFAKVAVNRRDP